MQITKSHTDRIGAITQTDTATLVVGRIDFANEADYQRHVEHLVTTTLNSGEMARPFDQWTEADGPVLWWTSPITEPPYVGTPLDTDWPYYHTHWTPLVVPRNLQNFV